MVDGKESNFLQILMGLNQERSLKLFQRPKDNCDGSVRSMWIYGPSVTWHYAIIPEDLIEIVM
jgi:hypothetical protein